MNENEFVFRNETDTISQSLDFTWNFGDGFFSSLFNVKHSYLGVGSYKVKLSSLSLNNCRNTVEKTIIVLKNPQAIFDTIIDVCRRKVTVLNYSINADKYHWEFGC